MLLMAPRRNNNSNSNIIVHQQHLQEQQPQQQQNQQQTLLLTTAAAFFNNTDNNNLIEPTTTTTGAIVSGNNGTMSPMQTSSNSNATSNSSNNIHHNNNSSQEQQFTRCCFPNGDCFKLDSPLISLDDLSDCVRVICNNENCNVGQFMHRECFETWEQSVLVTLKSIGRARSWSDRQRSQNLWTKKGYDLVYKACGCKCGRGHIRKDLEWSAPQPTSNLAIKSNGHSYVNGNSGGAQRVANGGIVVANGVGNCGTTGQNDDMESSKKKKKRNRNNQKPTLALTPLNPSGYHPNSQQQQQQQTQPQQQQQQQQVQQNGQTISNNNSGNSNNSNSNSVSNGNNNVASNNINSNSSTNISPNPNVGVIGSGLQNHHQQQQQLQQQNVVNSLSVSLTNGHGGNVLGLDLRARAGSLSSSGSGSTSPSASHSSDISISPIHHSQQQQQQVQQQVQQAQHQALQLQQQYQQTLLQNGLTKSILNGINGCLTIASAGNNPQQLLVAKAQPQQQQPPQQQQQQQQQNNIIAINGLPKHLSSIDQQQLVQQQKNKEVELYSERVRSTSGCNGIFSRRLDFSSFNLLPKTRLNSYQVKIEDEGNHGNDETRLFILSSLAQSQMSRVACILCEEPMLVFDRYPLVDGSFFLSPKQHSAGCIEVKYEGRALYLTCVCMGCLDGSSSNRVISCRFCSEIWDGSNLVLGTMYAYDIFAAMPCCAERLKCNNCFKLLLHPQQRLNFYSDYSHCVTCHYCSTRDTHFVKPLSYCYTKSSAVRHQLIA